MHQLKTKVCKKEFVSWVEFRELFWIWIQTYFQDISFPNPKIWTRTDLTRLLLLPRGTPTFPNPKAFHISIDNHRKGVSFARAFRNSGWAYRIGLVGIFSSLGGMVVGSGFEYRTRPEGQVSSWLIEAVS